MSPRFSNWKSQGETRTTSPFLIHALLFIFPRILQLRMWPSWHFTKILSKPNILSAVPRTSLPSGKIISLSSSSLITFLLPKQPQLLHQFFYWRFSFFPAIAAVNKPLWIWFERYFTFFSAVCANGLVYCLNVTF